MLTLVCINYVNYVTICINTEIKCGHYADNAYGSADHTARTARRCLVPASELHKRRRSV